MFHDFKVPIASPEDVIVLKLEWYRMGGEVSERQWNDVSRLVNSLIYLTTSETNAAIVSSSEGAVFRVMTRSFQRENRNLLLPEGEWPTKTSVA